MKYKNPRKTANRNVKQNHYLIVTTGEQTEINYFKALYDNLDDTVKKYITIEYEVCPINKLIAKANIKASLYPTNCSVWLVFDTDKDTEIIKTVIKEANCYGYNIAFSNPCIELWFLAYFGKSPIYKNNQYITASKQCIRDLEKYIVGYRKNDENIYNKLTTQGNETKAIKTAKNKYNNQKSTNILEMYGTTNIFILIENIKDHNC